MNNLKCHLCRIECSGPDQFDEHIAGVKHKRKLKLQAAIFPNIQQSTRTVDVAMPSSASNFGQCVLTPEVQELNAKLSSSCKSLSGDDYLAVDSRDEPNEGLQMQEPVLDLSQYNNPNFIPDNFLCKVCRVQCTGTVSFYDHIQGKKHVKRLKYLNISSSCANSNLVQNTITNAGESTLSKETDLPDASHQQDNSIESKIMNPALAPNCEISAVKTSIDMQPDTLAEGKLTDTVPNVLPIQYSQSVLNHKCELCKIICSGPDQYNQHIFGKQHKKKLFLQSAAAVAEVNIDDKKQDTGNGNLPPFSGDGTSISDYANLNPIHFKCYLCNVPCNSSRSFNLHLESKKHIRKASGASFVYLDRDAPKSDHSDDQLSWSSMANNFMYHGVSHHAK